MTQVLQRLIGTHAFDKPRMRSSPSERERTNIDSTRSSNGVKPLAQDSSHPSAMEMTKASLIKICKEHDLYRTPELNDKLYLNFKGFAEITTALSAYANLKALFLEGNALTSLEGLPPLPLLKCLFVHQNLITDLRGLKSAPALDTLNVSANRLENLKRLEEVPRLTTLIATDNLLKTADDISPVLLCPQLQTLDLQNNKIEDAAVLDVLEQLPELRCLYLRGNGAVTTVRNYRKVVISRMRRLTYLDDRPVFENERRLTEAWASGGVEGERREREKIKQETKERDRRNFEYLQQIRREGWKKRREAMGLPPGDEDPCFENLSSEETSEEEEGEEVMKARLQLEEWSVDEEEDGKVYLDSVKQNAKALETSAREDDKRNERKGPGHQLTVVKREHTNAQHERSMPTD